MKQYNKFLIIKFFLIYIIFLFVSGCATKNDELSIENINDPYEGLNRSVFSFNNNLDEYIFKPVARGWKTIPDFPRENLANLAETAESPLDIANAILQFDIEGVRITLSRFIINLTLGLGGMYDVASSDMFEIEKRNEDFGQTLAIWGLPEGPYTMLPIFGPSNIRDAVGRGVDTIFNPLTFVFRMNNFGFETRLPQPVVSGADQRAKYLGYVDDIESTSLDFYATMRSLYRQKRQQDINNGNVEKKKINFSMPDYGDIPSYEDSLEIMIPFSNQENLENIQKYPKKAVPSSNYPDYNEPNTKLLTN